MPTASPTYERRITIPAAVRKASGVETGDPVEFGTVAPGRFDIFARTRAMTALKGMFGLPRMPLSVDEMNAVIESRSAGKNRVRKED